MGDAYPGSTKTVLRDLLFILCFRQKLIFFSFLLITLVLGFAVYLITPRYDATVKIMVRQNPGQQLAPFRDLTSPSESNPRVDHTRDLAEIVKSREFAEQIVSKYGLDKRCEQKALHPGDLREQVKFFLRMVLHYPKDYCVRMGWADPDINNFFEDALDEFMEDALDVQVIEDTQVLSLTVSEEAPGLAADIANDLAELLRGKALIMDQSESDSVYEFTRKQLAGVESQYQRSLDDLARFKEQWHVISLDNEKTLKLNRLEDLRGQMTLVEADWAEKRARYKKITEDLLRQEKRLERLSSYNSLRDQERAVDIDLAGLEDRRASLAQSIESLENELAGLIKRENELLRLEQKKQNDEDVYLGLRDKFLKLNVQKNTVLSEFDLKVVQRAFLSPDSDPDWPQWVLIGPLILFLAAASALALALIVEYWSDSVKKPADLEQQTDIPVLGTIARL